MPRAFFAGTWRQEVGDLFPALGALAGQFVAESPGLLHFVLLPEKLSEARRNGQVKSARLVKRTRVYHIKQGADEANRIQYCTPPTIQAHRARYAKDAEEDVFAGHRTPRVISGSLPARVSDFDAYQSRHHAGAAAAADLHDVRSVHRGACYACPPSTLPYAHGCTERQQYRGRR